MPKSTPTSYELILKRKYNAPPERVFAAFTTPKQLMAWFRPENETMSTPHAEIDLRVGGKFRFVIHNRKENKDHVVEGEYREIAPNERLVYTWRWTSNENFTQETLVTVEFEADGDGTHLTLTHAGFPDAEKRDSHNWGHGGALELLAEFLKNQ